MSIEKQNITIVVSTIFQDAGDATRGIEIAKGIKRHKPDTFDVRIIFISRGSRFEERARDCGFNIYYAEPRSAGIGERHDYKMTPNNFIGEKILAKELIDGEVAALKELQPDVVIYGFWPMAGLAYRMIERKILGISYLPLPLTTEKFLDLIADIPEHVPIVSHLPLRLRRALLRYTPRFVRKRIPPLRQPNILWAASKAGWKGKLINLFDLLKADLTIVNDIPDYYEHVQFPPTIAFSGALFSQPIEGESLEDGIKNVFYPGNRRTKIFCTLGSSGTRDLLLEIVKVFTEGEGLSWDAVILSPISVCPIDEAKEVLGNRPGIYITDSFVPALQANALADLVICHGGQGTIQTAISCGTPLVGVAAQSEQFVNLSNVESQGAAIRIPMKKWQAKNIRAAVSKMIADDQFKKAADRLRRRLISMDGQKISAELIWGRISAEFPPSTRDAG